jgi:hypothetical protein
MGNYSRTRLAREDQLKQRYDWAVGSAGLDDSGDDEQSARRNKGSERLHQQSSTVVNKGGWKPDTGHGHAVISPHGREGGDGDRAPGNKGVTRGPKGRR